MNEVYKDLYALEKQLAKRDRFGIYLKIEKIFFDLQELIITAAFESRANKLPFLNSARIKVELLKRFFRSAFELHIIPDKKFIKFELGLREISKMINGWIAYLNK